VTRPIHPEHGVHGDFCAVAPSPQLRERLREELRNLRTDADTPLILAGDPKRPGFNDGTIRPPSAFPPGTPLDTVRSAAAERAPLRGDVRVIVVLVDFTDKRFEQSTERFEQLFFSTGTIPTGSVTEYYTDVTGGLVHITGQVVGPFTMPQTLAWYANDNYGIGKPSGDPRANILAQDAAQAANATVDFGPYDNDGDGYVDAFIVVHAGEGGEETGNSGDIWSHKWVLPQEYDADGTKIYSYLTIPENAKLGVAAHELGHLLFGFPDLYDTDYSSEGIGNWCLMAGGSWNGGGDTPAHPSAWCKAQQEWVTVDNVTADSTITIADVKTSRTVQRLWTDGTVGQEYFLLENRQQAGFDADLPAGGLLVWHIDESQQSNDDENHYLVALLQADGDRDLENDVNRGDGGDPYPGYLDNRSVTATSNPASTGYSGQSSLVAVTAISDPGDTMTATVSVHATGSEQPGDLEARVAALETRVAALERAVSQGGSALSAIGQGGGGVFGAASGRIPGARTATEGRRGGDGAVDALNAGLSAAAKAARDLVSEVQQWSPRRRT
jgi:immune inhibitor A